MTLYLLDAYALIYRGYFAFAKNPRINSKGDNTSAIFGFLITLDEMIKRAEEGYLAVVFDPKGGTFRHEEYPDYKANRQETPEAIRFGVPYIKELLRALGVRTYEVEGYEADDVIGTIATRMAQEHKEVEVLMVTPDKDYGQLVGDNVYILRPESGNGYARMGITEVLAKHDLNSITQVVDMLALMGDSADNVPGCPKVGPATASKLLKEYGSIDGIYSQIESIKGKLQERLIEHEEMVRLSQHLVTIVRDVPINFELEECRLGEIDLDEVTRICQILELRTHLKRYTDLYQQRKQSSVIVQDLPQGSIQQPSLFDDLFAPLKTTTPPENNSSTNGIASYDSTQVTYHTLTTLDEVEQMARQLEEHGECFAFDTETDGLDTLTAHIVGASFANKKGEAYYIALPDDQIEAARLLAPLAPLFRRSDIVKVGQNLKFDLEILARYGITEIAAPFFDTMIAHYLLNPELSHGMDYMALHYLSYRTIPITDLIGSKGRKQITMREVPLEQIAPYAAEDADITLRLYHFFKPQIEQRSLENLLYDLELPLMQVLMKMEQEGVAIDTEALQGAAQDLESRLMALEQEIYTAAGGMVFNINSPKLVGEVLFDRLGLGSKHKKTKSGAYATGEEILQKIKGEHPIVSLILQYRGLRKLLSTYVEALPQLINTTTGRIHTTYNQTVAATGRLSSTNPNLQNIPIRDDDGKEIRRAFVPLRPDDIFVSADYSQIELRLMAHLSGDEALITAFREGKDVHASTAAKIYNVPLDEVTSEMRRRAKTANFGIIYGISTFGLSERLTIPRKEASELIEGYFASYPKVKEYMDNAVLKARHEGYVETLLGRRRYLQDINSSNAVVRGYAERNAVNAPIQGSAADIIKLAMVRIQRRIEQEGLQSKMILQVHDELNFSVPRHELAQLTALVKEEMEGVCPDLLVPLTVEVGHGHNWLEAH